MADKGSDFGQPIPGYEVLELIGSGGAGSVYRARQTSLGREVALKVLRRDRAEQKTTLERTAKEARLLAHLDHPNIVRSIDFGHANDLMYFTMEYVDGQSAKQLLAAQGPLPIPDVLQIGEEIARALEHAANQGVTHRDVKPGNILLDKDGSVKLSDFGLARADLDRSLTRDGTTVGTPQYMAPEQVQYARRADLRSDLYSLGATLYHLATGVAPFDGDSVAEILHKVLYARPRPPEQHRAEIPAGLSRLIARLMARNPARRYQDAATLIRDLVRVRANLQQSDESPEVGLSWQEAAEPPRRLARRTAWAVGALALVALGVTLGLVFSGDDVSVDPAARRDQEQTVLDELSSEMDSGHKSPLETLAAIHAFRRDGTLTAISGVPRQELERLSVQRIEEVLADAARESRDRVQARIAAARFSEASEQLSGEFQATTERNLGTDVPQPEQLGGYDYGQAREAALHAVQKDLNDLEQRLLQAVQAGHDQAKRAVVAEVLGGPSSEGLLGRGEFDRARTLLADAPGGLQTAMRDAFVAAARTEGLVPPADLTYEAMLTGLPEAFRRERESDPFLATLEAEWRDAVRAVQVDLLAAIDELENAHQQRIEAGEIDFSVEQWDEELRVALADRGFQLDTLPEDPVEWKPRLTTYRERIATRRAAALDEWRAARSHRLVHGDDADGLMSRLESHDVPGAADWLEGFDARGIEALHQAWSAPVQELADWWQAAGDELEARNGQSVTLRDDRGRQHRGSLQYHGIDRPFQVGPRGELSLAQLHLESLQELASVEEVSPLTRAVLLAFWSAKSGDLEAQLAELDASNPVVVALQERLDAELAVSAEADRAANDEAEQLITQAREAQAQGRYEDALGLLRKLQRTGRLRRTARFRELKPELEDWEKTLRAAGEDQGVADALRPLYANASDFAVLGQSRVRVLYDFADAQQGQDFDLGGDGVLVANQAMRIEADPGSSRFRVWGPSLPLPVDRDHPFQLKLQLYSPFEQKEPPHLVLMRVAGVCVGLYAPRGVRLSFPAQLAVWEGALDEYSDRFYDPTMLTEPKKGRVVRNVGLDRARTQELELRYDPREETPIEVFLDGKLVDAIAAGRLERDPTRWEIRTPDAMHIQRFEFLGVLRSPQ